MISVILLLIPFFSCLANTYKGSLLNKLEAGVPNWMAEQADFDLASFQDKQLSKQAISDYYDESPEGYYLIKFTIRNNQIFTQCKTENSSGVDYRLGAYIEALKTISEVLPLPDVTFLFSIHDAFTLSKDVPVFSMCKRKSDRSAILLPDFEALREKFQVLPHRDLTTYEPIWERKKNLLIWRGSTAQASLDGELMRPDNVDRFSRVILCMLSEQYPEHIDAKFTFYAQGGENIASLQAFRAKQISFDRLIQHKYQIFIDGNASPYSASCWKWFTNSLVFKVDSPWIQWYFLALEPSEHYISIKDDLTDLVEKIQWAKLHDDEAKMIAKKCRNFALHNLTLPDNLLYLYYVICRYSFLNFID